MSSGVDRSWDSGWVRFVRFRVERWMPRRQRDFSESDSCLQLSVPGPAVNLIAVPHGSDDPQGLGTTVVAVGSVAHRPSPLALYKPNEVSGA